MTLLKGFIITRMFGKLTDLTGYNLCTPQPAEKMQIFTRKNTRPDLMLTKPTWFSHAKVSRILHVLSIWTNEREQILNTNRLNQINVKGPNS